MTQGAPSPDSSSGVQVAEIVAAISLAADLGLGRPMEHVLRSCAIASRVAEHADCTDDEVAATYWVTLFFTAGCTGVSFELSRFFGDDIAFRAGVYEMGTSNLDMFRYLVSHAGGDKGFFAKSAVVAKLVSTKMRALEESWIAHCHISTRLAERVGLGESVVTALSQSFEQWDGKGMPNGIGGTDLCLPIRICHVADAIEVGHSEGGFEHSLEFLRQRADKWFDPALVELWSQVGADVLTEVDSQSSWDDVVGRQPWARGPLTETELDDALALIGDYADLKSPWFTGHSRGVSDLAAAAAECMGAAPADVTLVRRAGLVHDIGRNGIPNSIWDREGPLSDSDWERVHLHAYFTDRVLRRGGRLADLAAIASSAHERAHGTGYPRAIGGATIPQLGRILAAADVYHSMLEERPHRPAHDAATTAAELRRMARDGELESTAVDAVLQAAGHRTKARPSLPAGLTPREAEVLVVVARGATTRQVASKLGITPKTAGNHIERIYSKIGVSSRAMAAMFAMQHGLVSPLDVDAG